jgi:hypothetical protein
MEDEWNKRIQNSPFPLVVVDEHLIIKLVLGDALVIPTPHVQRKYGLRVKVRLIRIALQRRKAQYELEIDGVLGWRFPLQSEQVNVGGMWTL